MGRIEPLKKEDFLGSTITTIAGSDTLKDSRAVINTNFTNLNNDKIEISTTTLPLLTTLINLATANSLTINSTQLGVASSTPFAQFSVGAGGSASSTISTGKFCMYAGQENGVNVYVYLKASAANNQPFATTTTSCF